MPRDVTAKKGGEWPSDLALVHAVRRGDRAAANDLVERLACIPAMIRARERRLGAPLTEHERDETVQETLAAMWAKLGRFRGRTSVEAWAYGFALREHYKALERRRRAPRQAPDPVLFGGVQEEEEPREDYRAVHESLQSLEPPNDEIVRLKHFEDLTFSEIGRELRLSPNTVKTRYYRAIGRLRSQLRSLWREVSE